MTVSHTLTVADTIVADCAEHLVNESHSLARLRRERMTPDRDALREACRAFWMLSPERYENCLRRLAFGVAA